MFIIGKYHHHHHPYHHRHLVVLHDSNGLLSDGCGGVSWLCKVHSAPVLMCLDIGDSEIGDSGGDSEMGKSGDSEMGDSGGGHEVIRSCVGGNGDDDDVSWLCQVQAAPDLMCWILVMVTLIFVILFGMILL